MQGHGRLIVKGGKVQRKLKFILRKKERRMFYDVLTIYIKARKHE